MSDLAKTPEQARLDSEGTCALTHPLLGRCAWSLRLDSHHVVPRSAGGKVQIALCDPHHDLIHSGEDFDPEVDPHLRRVVLTRHKRQVQWLFDPSGEAVELREDVAETLRRAMPEDLPEGTYGYFQRNSHFQPDPDSGIVYCPACSRKLGRGGRIGKCNGGDCGFTFDGWIWMFWPDIAEHWQDRAVEDDDLIGRLQLASEAIGWKMAEVLGDMAVGRLWTLHGYDSLDEYAKSVGRKGVTFRQYLKAEERRQSLDADLREPVRKLPIHLLVARGVKFEDLERDQILDLVESREKGAATRQLKHEIDDMLRKQIGERSEGGEGDEPQKREVEVTLIAKAVTFELRLTVEAGDDPVQLAQKRVYNYPTVVGAEWAAKGHQVKKL